MEKISNPRMQLFDGEFAGEAYAKTDDYYSLRDHFAGLAMQGHLSSEYYVGMNTSKENLTGIAKMAYLFADAMLEERTNKI